MDYRRIGFLHKIGIIIQLIIVYERNINCSLKFYTMDSSMETFFESISTENNSLTTQVNDLESERINLSQRVIDLEKALDKQTKLHRKYVEDVDVTEKLRIDDFKVEKRNLSEQIKLLTKQTRQQTKDLDFFKNAYEEVVKENDNIAFYKTAYEELIKENQGSSNSSRTTRASPQAVPSRPFPKSLAETSPALLATTLTSKLSSSGGRHKSSKVLSQLSEKLLMENKKLKIKVDNHNETIRVLKAKNKKLESFKQKIDKKKLQFCHETEELKNLLKLTERKNKTTYTPEILAELGELSIYKMN